MKSDGKDTTFEGSKQNRDVLDIVRAIRAVGLAKPTRILQKGNLTHDWLLKYLGELETKKLIKGNVGKGYRYYTLIDSGIKLL